MFKIVLNIKFMYFYLKGVMQFRAKNYDSANLFFEKAIHFNQSLKNELLYQYYGQTLMALNHIDKAFDYLSKSYNTYEEKEWKVSDDEEYQLVKNTLDALKYLNQTYNLKIEKADYEKTIRRIGAKP